MASESRSAETWTYRSPFPADSWLSEAMSYETDVLARAFQFEICNFDQLPTVISKPEQPLNIISYLTAATSTTSSESTDSPQADQSHRNHPIAPPKGKIVKRKSRASKKAPTTFINADPANFRQMVQQVTGVRCLVESYTDSSILKPEPQRVPRSSVTGLHAGFGILPTLDTSAFLLNQNSTPVMNSLPQSNYRYLQTAPESTPAMEFQGFQSPFPTLESWSVL